MMGRKKDPKRKSDSAREMPKVEPLRDYARRVLALYDREVIRTEYVGEYQNVSDAFEGLRAALEMDA